MPDENGYIKFSCEWIKGEPLPEKSIKELNFWRKKMFDLGLIGMYDNGIGFGNISIRIGETRQFIITGSATGGTKNLGPEHYVKVTEVRHEKNSLVCVGPIKASSESMTHAAVYDSDPNAMAVIHVHNLKIWKKLLNKVPTTSKDATYGTPEMAEEVMRIFRETDVKKKGIFVMGGHEEGIITFGKTLEEVGSRMIEYFEEYK
ncbi:MAG: class II aldolase/adducin family protein [Candidatus Aenigmarchaeota archaeon]|nr:class II aldolase/adducin family protein [Candidatus Aenigmarchaeota archaeon]